MHKKFSSKAAKNLIIVIADGMSIATQTATRAYLGNEEINLSFEEFPYVGLSKTYCVNYQVSDSACTATALLSGIKTNFGVLSMNANVPLDNCSSESSSPDNGVDSIFKHAQLAGKATAIVTNTKITDATVAGKKFH
jgi:alkaline phosphatase